MAVLPPSMARPPADPRKSDCIICCELVDTTKLIRPCRKCSSKWCVCCLQTSFENAIAKKSGFSPPECHGLIQLHTIIDHLDESTLHAYRAAFEEWLTDDRVYCPVPTCSAFIPKRDIPCDDNSKLAQQTKFQCKKCNTDICLTCRQIAHQGACDTSAKKEEMAMLAKFKIKQCPRCNRAVRKMYGCPAMSCVCGAHFCYGCGLSLTECDGACIPEDESSEDDSDDSQSTDDSDDDSDSDDDDDQEDEGRRVQEEVAYIIRPQRPNNNDDKAKMETDVVANEPGSSSNSSGDGRDTAVLSQQDTRPHPQPSAPPMPPRSVLQLLNRTTTAVRTLVRRSSTGSVATAPTTYPTPASTRPSATPRRSGFVDLDAGGEARWAMSGDFGEEPKPPLVSQVWSCSHHFCEFREYSKTKDGSQYGNFARAECNRCFSKVTARPPFQVRENSDSQRKRRKTSKMDHSVGAGEASEQPGSITSLECTECGLVVCMPCQEKQHQKQENEKRLLDAEEKAKSVKQ